MGINVITMQDVVLCVMSLVQCLLDSVKTRKRKYHYCTSRLGHNSLSQVGVKNKTPTKNSKEL